MQVLLAITVGALYAAGFYMILRRSLVKLIMEFLFFQFSMIPLEDSSQSIGCCMEKLFLSLIPLVLFPYI